MGSAGLILGEISTSARAQQFFKKKKALKCVSLEEKSCNLEVKIQIFRFPSSRSVSSREAALSSRTRSRLEPQAFTLRCRDPRRGPPFAQAGRCFLTQGSFQLTFIFFRLTEEIPNLDPANLWKRLHCCSQRGTISILSKVRGVQGSGVRAEAPPDLHPGGDLGGAGKGSQSRLDLSNLNRNRLVESKDNRGKTENQAEQMMDQLQLEGETHRTNWLLWNILPLLL